MIDNGLICIVPVAASILTSADDLEERAVFSLKGHIGAVTSLFYLESGKAYGKNLLISGGSDGSVRIWNLE